MLALYLSLLDSEGATRLFVRIYEKYERKLYAVARHILGKPEDAEDAVHSAMVNVALHMETAEKIYSDERSELESWLVTIVKNTAFDMMRKRGRMAEFPEEWDAPAPDCVSERTEFDALVDLIRAMPEGYRAILELRLVEEWSFKEIGRAVGLTEDAARMRYRRGLKLLRKRLREEGYEYDGCGV